VRVGRQVGDAGLAEGLGWGRVEEEEKRKGTALYLPINRATRACMLGLEAVVRAGVQVTVNGQTETEVQVSHEEKGVWRAKTRCNALTLSAPPVPCKGRAAFCWPRAKGWRSSGLI
jgi:hypothetical protein